MQLQFIKQNFSQLLAGLGTVVLVGLFTGASLQAEIQLAGLVNDTHRAVNAHDRDDDRRANRHENRRHSQRSSSSDDRHRSSHAYDKGHKKGHYKRKQHSNYHSRHHRNRHQDRYGNYYSSYHNGRYTRKNRHGHHRNGHYYDNKVGQWIALAVVFDRLLDH